MILASKAVNDKEHGEGTAFKIAKQHHVSLSA